jgi:hypothetical protein
LSYDPRRDLSSILVDPHMTSRPIQSGEGKDVFIRLVHVSLTLILLIMLRDGDPSEIKERNGSVVVEPCGHLGNCRSRAGGGRRVEIIAQDGGG